MLWVSLTVKKNIYSSALSPESLTAVSLHPKVSTNSIKKIPTSLKLKKSSKIQKSQK